MHIVKKGDLKSHILIDHTLIINEIERSIKFNNWDFDHPYGSVIQNLGKIDQLTKAVSSTTLEMTNVKTAVGGVEDTLTGVNKVAEDTKRDVASLTDGISGENQVSSAIEMAREGASIEKIVAVTGISKEEAEAVVRFHKPDS